MSPQEFAKLDAKRKTFGKDSVLQAQDLEMLLSWITRNSGQSFQNTMIYKDFFKRVHQAFQDKTTGVRDRREAFNAEINRLFNVTGTRSRAKLMGELKIQSEESGVFRYQRDPNNRDGIKYKKIQVDDARLLLSQYDKSSKGLTDYQAEAIRQRLADLDERLKDAVKSRTGDEFTDDILTALLSENDKNVVVIPEIAQPGELTQQPLSPLQALYFRLCWDQPSVRYKMAFNGWTSESIAQLDKFIDSRPGVRELGKYMVADLAKDFPNVQEIYKKLYMTTMKGNDSYFPTSYNVNKDIAAANSAEMGNLYSGQMSVTPGTLSARKFHLQEPKVEDAVSMYMRHVLQMEHFKSHAEVARDLRSLFNSRDVGESIRQYYGQDVRKYLGMKIEDFVNGGKIDAQHEAMLDRIQSVFARTRIWWNSVSMFKQIFGGAQYINDIPTSAFFKGIADFAKNPMENMNMLRDTDYFKNRWAGAVDRDIGLILSKHNYSAEEGANIFSQLDEIGSIPTRFGDAFSVIVGGYAVYKFHYDNLVKEGMPAADAHKQALQEWEMSTERTQQSGAVHKMNRYQIDSSFSRVWTTFQSNPILIANAFLESAMDVKANRGLKGAAYAKLARRAATAWLIGGFIMSAVSQAAKNGIEFDEYEWARVFKDTLMGPFNSFTFLGYGADVAANAFFGLRENNSRSIDDIGGSIRSGIKLASGDFEDEEVWKLVEKGFIGLGIIPSPIAPAAIHAGGIMRELRRYYNLAVGSEK